MYTRIHTYTHTNTHPIYMYLLLGLQIRLVGGATNIEGRVEIRYGGTWGTICDDAWDNNDAAVICRMLGYDGGTGTSRASFGQGAGDILMDNVGCTGREASIGLCPHNGWGSHNCRHYEDAGVICTIRTYNHSAIYYI